MIQTSADDGPCVKVVDAEGDIQGHFAAQTFPSHRVWVVAQRTVQVPSLHHKHQPPLIYLHAALQCTLHYLL